MGRAYTPLVHPDYICNEALEGVMPKKGPVIRRYRGDCKKSYDYKEEIYQNHHVIYDTFSPRDAVCFYSRSPYKGRAFKTFIERTLLSQKIPVRRELVLRNVEKGLESFKKRAKFQVTVNEDGSLKFVEVKKLDPSFSFNCDCYLIVRRHALVFYKISYCHGKTYFYEFLRLPRDKDLSETLDYWIGVVLPEALRISEVRHFSDDLYKDKTCHLEDPRSHV